MKAKEILAKILDVDVKSINLHKSGTLRVDEALEAMEEYSQLQTSDVSEKIGEKILFKYTSSSKFNQIKYMNWTSAEVIDAVDTYFKWMRDTPKKEIEFERNKTLKALYELKEANSKLGKYPPIKEQVCEICGSTDEHIFDNPSCDCNIKV